MKKKWFLVGISLLIVLVFLCACQSGKKGSEKKDSENEAEQHTKVISGYEEQQYAMPEGMDTIVPYATRIVDDIGFMVLGMKENAYYVWSSDDYGKTWGEPVALPEELRGEVMEGESIAGQRSIRSASISPEGELALIRATYYDNNNFTCDYWTWKPGETEKKLNIELEMDEFYENHARTQESVSIKPNAFIKWKYVDNGELLAEAMNGQVYLIDSDTGEVRAQTAYVQGMKRIEYTQVIDGKILVQTAEGIFMYLADTGEFVESEKTIQSDITELRGTEEYTYVGNTYELFETEGSLYEIGKSGIYLRDGAEKEEIISGEDALIGNTMIRYLNAFRLEEGFLIPCVENGQYYTVYYHYTGGEDAGKKKELKIYSLRENDNLTLAIEQYKGRHSEIKVQLETGLSEGGGVTVSDAIRNLSTKIMAGDGPDVILLDEMAVETYIEKGILVDITDIYEEVDEKEGLLSNVAEVYKKDGKLYAIPTHFYVPVVLGAESDIQSIQDLESLERKVEELTQQGKSCFADKDVRGVLNYCTAISSAAWIEDGKLQEKELKAFLRCVKNICGMENLEEGSYDVDNHIQDFRDDYIQPIFYHCGVTGLAMGLTKGFTDVSQIDSVLNEAEGSAWKIQNGQAENIFVPSAIIGISGRAANKEEAKAFLQFLLTSETQKYEMRSGFPVNRTALKELAMEESEKEEWSIMRALKNGETMELTVKPANQDRIQEFSDKLETLDTPELTDKIVLQTVNEYALSYIRGEIDLDKAMEDIKSRVNLHLAE